MLRAGQVLPFLVITILSDSFILKTGEAFTWELNRCHLISKQTTTLLTEKGPGWVTPQQRGEPAASQPSTLVPGTPLGLFSTRNASAHGRPQEEALRPVFRARLPR